jgi:hypothetical protein
MKKVATIVSAIAIILALNASTGSAVAEIAASCKAQQRTSADRNVSRRPTYRLAQDNICRRNCEIVYNQCVAVGAPNCANQYRVCMNAC